MFVFASFISFRCVMRARKQFFFSFCSIVHFELGRFVFIFSLSPYSVRRWPEHVVSGSLLSSYILDNIRVEHFASFASRLSLLCIIWFPSHISLPMCMCSRLYVFMKTGSATIEQRQQACRSHMRTNETAPQPPLHINALKMAATNTIVTFSLCICLLWNKKIKTEREANANEEVKRIHFESCI